MTDQARAELRRECVEDLLVIRESGLDERVFRLLEKLVQRLDRLECGQFVEDDAPTRPDAKRTSSATWKNDGVLAALQDGKPK